MRNRDEKNSMGVPDAAQIEKSTSPLHKDKICSSGSDLKNIFIYGIKFLLIR